MFHVQTLRAPDSLSHFFQSRIENVFLIFSYFLVGYFSSHGLDEIAKNLERKNNDCKNDVKIGEPGQFNWILILSVQGSGNTWTRQLFQSLTGYYAGGVYHEIQDELDTDELYEQSPFPGEHFSPESGRVLGIKSHARGHIRKAHAVVLVIRNPYDTIKANFNRIMAEKDTGDGLGAHTGTIDPALFKSLKWRRYIHNTAEMWRQYYKDAVHLAVNSKKNFHFLWYDLLKTEKEEQMREVYAFLENEAVPHGKLEVKDIDHRLNCIKMENLDNFKRKNVELNFDIYKPDEIEMINSYIREYIEFFRENDVEFPEEIVRSWLR